MLLKFTTTNLTGYLLECGQDPHHTFRHRFNGEHHIDGADCPNCHLPLLKLLEIDTTDERLGLSMPAGITSIPLFYCFRCELFEETFCYQLSHEGSIRVTSYHASAKTGNRGYDPNANWSQPLFFPAGDCYLRELTIDENDHLLSQYIEGLVDIDLARFYKDIYTNKEMEHLYEIKNQIGGLPFLPQGWRCNFCHKCGWPMPFLASVSDVYTDNDGVQHEYTGESIQLQYSYCQKCAIVGVNMINWD